METNKTISEAVGSRIARFAENASLKKCVERSATNTLFLFACFALISPAGAWYFFLGVISWQGWLLVKVAGAWLLFFRWREIKKLGYKLKLKPNHKTTGMLYNVPIAELLSFIFDHSGLPVKEFCSKFGCTVHSHGKISRFLCDAGVLYKGEYNRLTLSESLTRAKIASILGGQTLRVVVNGVADPETPEEVSEKLSCQIKEND